ncbi:MAG: M56 family metallopeptidase [Rudaea sp.]
MAIAQLFASQWFSVTVDLLGSALLHFLWQGAIVGALYALLRPLCASVTARYRLGLGAMLALALCPVFTLIWLWPHSGDATAAMGGQLRQFAGTFSIVAAQVPAGWHLHSWLPWLVAIWFGGVFTIGMRSLWQWQHLLRIVKLANPVPDWESRLNNLRARFGLRRPVRLLASARALTPMLIGWFKPVILLPASMLTGFAPDQLELIIAHELGHVRRWDYLANLIQVVIETVLFYHPVVHWISRDVRNLREECCDDLVLQVARGNPLTYARALADLEQLRQELVLLPALGAGGGVLLDRVRRIVGATEMIEPLPRNHTWPMLVAVVAMACMLWHPHADTVIPQASRVLAAIPTHALALTSGNAALVEPAAAAAAKSPVQPAQNLPVTSIDSRTRVAVTSEVAPPPSSIEQVRIAHPRVKIALSNHIENIGDLSHFSSMSAPATLALGSDETATLAPPVVAPVHVVAPSYPPRAMLAGITGNVDLAYSVDSSGKVRNVRVLHAIPSGVFDATAKAALSEWRFPASAVGVEQTQNFAFTLPGHGNTDKCQKLTGSLICRQPGE